jgi:(p)ppGpp synthase/HD superfamily hydrolase
MSFFRNNVVARAEIVARFAHRGQIDKTGVDYAEHCRAVAALTACAIDPLWQYKPDAIAAAWLHDTGEDTPLGHGDLIQLGFSIHTVNAVTILTEHYDEPHDDLVRRARDADGIEGTIARFVRVADILHNGMADRGGYMTPEKLIARRDHALAILRGDIP